jgi:hypothetical protein
MQLMKLRCLSILIVVFFYVQAIAQEDPLVKSYRLYMAKSWDSLYTLRKPLLTSMGQSESYYLRYRLGEAAWMLQDYKTSAADFGQAFRLNSTDTFSLFYLQASLLEQGKLCEAIGLNQSLKKINPKSPRLLQKKMNDYIFAESGLRISNEDAIGNLYFNHVGMNLQTTNKWSTYLGYSYLTQSLYQNNGEPFVDLVQQNFLARLRWQIREDLNIQPYFGYLDIQLNFSNNSRSFDQFQFTGLQISKSFEKTELDFGVSYSNFFLGSQYSMYGSNTWFLGSKRKTALSIGCIVQEDEGDFGTALKGMIRFRPAPKLWVTLDGYLGNTYNQLEDLGYLPNNSSDLTRWRARTTLTSQLNKNLLFYLTGSLESREEFLDGFNYTLGSVFLGCKINPFSGNVSK